jgi:hypothetical protein
LWSTLDEVALGLPEMPRDPHSLLMERAYEIVDAELGELVRVLEPDDDLLILSDHGMRTSVEHDPECIFIAQGPSFRPGRVTGLTAEQLLPTFLKTIGAPIPAGIPAATPVFK